MKKKKIIYGKIIAPAMALLMCVTGCGDAEFTEIKKHISSETVDEADEITSGTETLSSFGGSGAEEKKEAGFFFRGTEEKDSIEKDSREKNSREKNSREKNSIEGTEKNTAGENTGSIIESGMAGLIVTETRTSKQTVTTAEEATAKPSGETTEARTEATTEASATKSSTESSEETTEKFSSDSTEARTEEPTSGQSSDSTEARTEEPTSGQSSDSTEARTEEPTSGQSSDSTEARTEEPTSGQSSDSTEVRTEEPTSGQSSDSTEARTEKTTAKQFSDSTETVTEAAAEVPTECSHYWIADSHWEHHDAVYSTYTYEDRPAWDEPVRVTRTLCGVCGRYYDDDNDYWAHDVCAGGYTHEKVTDHYIHHDATYATETCLVEDAWDELVIDGYHCRYCGETRLLFTGIE